MSMAAIPRRLGNSRARRLARLQPQPRGHWRKKKKPVPGYNYNWAAVNRPVSSLTRSCSRFRFRSSNQYADTTSTDD